MIYNSETRELTVAAKPRNITEITPEMMFDCIEHGDVSREIFIEWLYEQNNQAIRCERVLQLWGDAV